MKGRKKERRKEGKQTETKIDMVFIRKENKKKELRN